MNLVKNRSFKILKMLSLVRLRELLELKKILNVLCQLFSLKYKFKKVRQSYLADLAS